MPELPEVETVRRALLANFRGQIIDAVEFFSPRLRSPLDPRDLARIAGRQICDIHRFGKYLVFELDRGFIKNHLGMSGKWLRRPHRERHDHIALRFGREMVFYHDPRRFGEFRFCDDLPQINTGMEPLSVEFTDGWLFRRLKENSRPIKPLLLDQKVIAGIGNIYASESLFLAAIHPTRTKLSQQKCGDLRRAIVTVLEKAISAGGTTLKDFRNPDNRGGYFARALQVYDRTGCPCFRCSRLIKKFVQAGRSTFYCPGCQH